MAIKFNCIDNRVGLFFDGEKLQEVNRGRKLQLNGKDFLPKFRGTKVEDILGEISFYLEELPEEFSFLSAIILDNVGKGFSITLMTDHIDRDSWEKIYSFNDYISQLEELLIDCIIPIKSYAKNYSVPPYHNHSILGVMFELRQGDLLEYVSECAIKLSNALNDADRRLTISKSTEKIMHRNTYQFFEGIHCGLEENLTTEFKEIKGGNPKESIQRLISKYIISFLNSQGGSIYWGIKDDGIVKGIQLTSIQKDQINNLLASTIHNIDPAIDPTKVEIFYHDVLNKKGYYVIEILVPKSRLELLHFNTSGETWVRLEGCSKYLRGVALQECILERSQKTK